MWERHADRAHVAHDVQLPVRVPFLVRNLLQVSVPRDADVVHEDVEPSEHGDGLAHGASGMPGSERSTVDMSDLADARRSAPAAGEHSRALGEEEPRGLQPDPPVEPVTRHLLPSSSWRSTGDG